MDTRALRHTEAHPCVKRLEEEYGPPLVDGQAMVWRIVTDSGARVEVRCQPLDCDAMTLSFFNRATGEASAPRAVPCRDKDDILRVVDIVRSVALGQPWDPA